ncbi:hypothetical protein [Lysinibacillus boronitolerans]|uniref:CopG family transcriptional regulator n=1 Tax=Lysinibacillus boronitolerans JCM 21713 = 10a = NBRC 103108 TaxID=1294264 RepID=A0ABR4Y5Q9_9BACI|nr:hypothetical protein [Lysinibacillus boronitolerans]KGR88855.1 hypothetical protein CD31_02430 [Lysinibacillus boronitolerans JCM 21713 = 10a = NBRC 103108]
MAEITLEEIKSRIFKDHEGVSNYIHVSIEEMDWLVEQAEKVQRLEKEKEEAYQTGYKQGKFDELMDNF